MEPVHIKFDTKMKSEDYGGQWWKDHGYKDRWGHWQVRMNDKGRDSHDDHDSLVKNRTKKSEDNEAAAASGDSNSAP